MKSICKDLTPTGAIQANFALEAVRACSSLVHQVTAKTPTAVAGKGSPGTSWGHCLCLGEDKWPGAFLSSTSPLSLPAFQG